MSAVSDSLPTGSIILGKYRVQRVLGRGGMGVVYEVEHLVTEHRRALKLLKSEASADQSLVQRFLRESTAAAKIKSPRVVETFDAGVLESGQPYIVMEMINGVTLLARKRSPITFQESIDILIQLCDGVSAAHQAGIVHRDLKPENIIITIRDGRRFVKILDFGIALFNFRDADRTTAQGMVVGTPFYMSPEHIGNLRDLDPRTDVFAIGVMAYELFTNHHPFSDSRNVMELVTNLATLQPKPVREWDPNLPKDLDVVLRKALSKSRQARYQDAGELGQALLELANITGPVVDASLQATMQSMLLSRGVSATSVHPPAVTGQVAIGPSAAPGVPTLTPTTSSQTLTGADAGATLSAPALGEAEAEPARPTEERGAVVGAPKSSSIGTYLLVGAVVLAAAGALVYLRSDASRDPMVVPVVAMPVVPSSESPSKESDQEPQISVSTTASSQAVTSGSVNGVASGAASSDPSSPNLVRPNPISSAATSAKVVPKSSSGLAGKQDFP